jgi:hypothetical protein
MALSVKTNTDFNNNEAQNVSLQKLTTDPTGGSLVDGKIWLFNNGAASNWRVKFGADGSAISLAREDIIPAIVQTAIDNAINGIKWGESCRVATTANGTLSTAFANGQTVDGVTLVTGDRILLKNQSDDTENGVYTVNASGAPSRAGTGSDLANHSFMVTEGTINADTSWVCPEDSITFGVTSVSFNQNGAGTTPDATTSIKGKVELATQAEAEARSDSTKALTPSSVQRFGIMYSADFASGDWVGGSAPYTITIAAGTHNCGASKKLMIQTFEDGTPNQMCLCDTTVSDAGEVVIKTNEKFDGHFVIVGIA